MAIGNPGIPRLTTTYTSRRRLAGSAPRRVPLGTLGGTRVSSSSPRWRVRDPRVHAAETSTTRGASRIPAPARAAVDGQRRALSTIGGHADLAADGHDRKRPSKAPSRTSRYAPVLTVQRGPHDVVAPSSEAPIRGTRSRSTALPGAFDTLKWTARRDRLLIPGPFDPAQPTDTPSRAQIFSCRPATTTRESPLRQAIIATLAARYRRPGRGDARRCWLLRRGEAASASIAASSARSSACWPARSSSSASSAIRQAGAAARCTASATSSWPRGCRSSCGAASRTTSCSTSARRAAGRRVLERAGAADAGRSRAEALVENFAGQWLQLRNLQNAHPRPDSFRTSTTTCGSAFRARPSCSSRASCARTAASSIC